MTLDDFSIVWAQSLKQLDSHWSVIPTCSHWPAMETVRGWQRAAAYVNAQFLITNQQHVWTDQCTQWHCLRWFTSLERMFICSVSELVGIVVSWLEDLTSRKRLKKGGNLLIKWTCESSSHLQWKKMKEKHHSRSGPMFLSVILSVSDPKQEQNPASHFD